MTRYLIINGVTVPLPDSELVPLSFAANDIGDLSEQNGNGSEQFTIPNTAEVRALLGWPDDCRSFSEIPYRKLVCKYVQNGEEIIANGLGIIQNANDTSIELFIVSGNSTFFKEIKDKTLADLDLSVWDHVWNNGNILNANIQMDGYIYPIIQWHADSNAGKITSSSRQVDTRYLLPCFFAFTILNKIAQEAGYTNIGPLMSSTEMRNLVHCPGNLARSDGWSELHEFNTTKAADEQWVKVSQASPWVDVVHFTAAGDFDGSAWYAVDALLVSFNTSGVLGFQNGEFTSLTIDITNTSAGVTYVSQVFTLNPTEATLVSGGIPVNKTYDLNTGIVQVSPGDAIYVRITYQGPPPYGSVISTYAIYAGARFSANIENEYVLGATITVSDIIGDMKQVDFVKGIMQYFGVVPRTDDRRKEVYWGQFKEVVANKPKAVNWTDKVNMLAGRSVKHRIGRYAQINWMKWKEDETVQTQLGDDIFLIDDKTLANDVTLFTQPWAATETPILLQGESVPEIKRLEGGRPSAKVEPRLLMLNKKNFPGNPIRYVDGTGWYNDQQYVLPICYFIYTGMPYNMNFGAVMQRHYSELITMLTRAKILNIAVLLDSTDISKLDFYIPVYLDQEQRHFYLNTITDWTDSSDDTDVELIRL